MDKAINELPQQAFNSAKGYEQRNGGCPQCTLAGIFDALGMENDAVFKAATGLADGIGLTGDGHCGALSGGVMAIGHLYGRERKDFGDMMKLLKANTLSKALHDRFVKKYGSCRCADIQHSMFGRFFNLYDPQEMKAALEAGMLETCSTVVGETARMTVEIILEERGKEENRGKKP
ncbi:MAG: C-GCAxxG-C-C family protein [Spirochaetes bacterium]|jgi:C_GCAxxG_C_C family probable redox protein|nr:C-GCAxxG-C-C family protein [Spirochaetota bacterium]